MTTDDHRYQHHQRQRRLVHHQHRQKLEEEEQKQKRHNHDDHNLQRRDRDVTVVVKNHRRRRHRPCHRPFHRRHHHHHHQKKNGIISIMTLLALWSFLAAINGGDHGNIFRQDSWGIRGWAAHANEDEFAFANEYEAGLPECRCLTPDEVERLGEDKKNEEEEEAQQESSAIIDEDEHEDRLVSGIDPFFANETNLRSYGFGCRAHDHLTIQSCLDGCAQEGMATIAPPPIDCDRSWCQRRWCWVDPNACTLLTKRSSFFSRTSGRYYSYATCWEMDSFTRNNRLGSLEGRTMRVGFNGNSGGWEGAYNAEKNQFKGPIADWSGPAVSFVVEAAQRANFLINLTIPPPALRPHSLQYFGGSNFDYCVYAVALGYLDFCVAQYTVTDRRAATTDFLLLNGQDLRLIVLKNPGSGGTWERFMESASTIFEPFDVTTWAFVVFFVIPVLGGLMVVHEIGQTGSAFPRTEAIVEIDEVDDDDEDEKKDDEKKKKKTDGNGGDDKNDDTPEQQKQGGGGGGDEKSSQQPKGKKSPSVLFQRALSGVVGSGDNQTKNNPSSSSSSSSQPHPPPSSTPTTGKVKERPIPLIRHVGRSIYVGLLSVLQQSYDQSVVTYGAMLNLLGLSFFILTIIAVYTANLAALLSQKPVLETISGIESAVASGYRICSERKNMEIVRNLYPNITDDTFVSDPIHLGGDGRPGFSCPNCSARRRVFEMLNPRLAGGGGGGGGGESGNGDSASSSSLYCHAAIAPLEDLEVEHKNGVFCNLSVVGDVVGQVQTGFPIYEGVSEALISLFLKLKNDGVYEKQVLTSRPESACIVDEGGEGSALSIEQLTGIWIVSFGFALLGLAVTLWSSPRNPFRRGGSGRRFILFCCPRGAGTGAGGKSSPHRRRQVQEVVGYDQTGNRVNVLESGDEWIRDQTIMLGDGQKRIFVGDDTDIEDITQVSSSSSATTRSRRQVKNQNSISLLSLAEWDEEDDEGDDFDDGLKDEEEGDGGGGGHEAAASVSDLLHSSKGSPHRSQLQLREFHASLPFDLPAVTHSPEKSLPPIPPPPETSWSTQTGGLEGTGTASASAATEEEKEEEQQQEERPLITGKTTGDDDDDEQQPTRRELIRVNDKYGL